MKAKILLVNDDESIREIFQMYLKLKKYDVYQTSNGIDALQKAKEIKPDLILLDVMVSGLNGYDVCRSLKEDSNTKDIPVLFLSSLLDTAEKVKGLEYGAVDFINSMADYAEILARVETHLKIRELSQQLYASNKELMQKQQLLNDDLKAAAVIQQSLLPINQPIIPNLEIEWFCAPCQLVGGDICNIFPLDKEWTIFYMLDVSGHGVPSAMMTVSITQYLQEKQLVTPPLSPKQVVSALNQDYPFEKYSMFSTICYMFLNNQNGKLILSSAGHPPAIILSPAKPYRLLTAHGILIGVDNHFVYEEIEEQLQPGDKVILYTDGIIEFTNSQGEMYGDDRFFNLLESYKSLSIKEMIRRLRLSLENFGDGVQPRDDISILGLGYKTI